MLVKFQQNIINLVLKKKKWAFYRIILTFRQYLLGHLSGLLIWTIGKKIPFVSWPISSWIKIQFSIVWCVTWSSGLFVCSSHFHGSQWWPSWFRWRFLMSVISSIYLFWYLIKFVKSTHEKCTFLQAYSIY